MNKIWGVLGILLVFNGMGFAQSAGENRVGCTFSGTVVDATTGETLPGANIQLRPGATGTAADRHGRFSLNRVPPGRYLLLVSFIGYESFRDSVILAPNTSPFLPLALPPKPLNAPEVSVSAERDRQLRTINLSQESLEMRDLQMTSVIAEPDLFRSLSFLAGVVQASDYNSRFYVRGGRGNENHVLVDGVTLHNPYHALGFFSTFDVDAIKNVEIYRGIFPARYSERLSSVTNVILRDGNANRFSGTGSLSLATTKFLLEGPLLKYNAETTGRKWTFMVSGRRSYIDRFVDFPFWFYDFTGKSVFDSGNRTRLVLHGFLGKDQITTANDGTFPQITWKNRAVGLQWFQILSGKFSCDTHLSYSDFRSDAINLLLSYQQEDILEQRNRIREVNYQTELNYQITSRHRFLLGYAYARYHIEQYLDSFFREIFQNQWRQNGQQKMYAEFSGSWSEKIIYEAGLTGLAFSRRNRAEISPRIGLKYLLNENWQVQAGIGRHYQALTSLNDDDDMIVLFDAWIPTPAERQLPRADHYGLGIAYFRQNQVSADMELYYRHYDHLTRFNRTQRAAEPFYLDGWAEAFGAEFRMNYDWKSFFGFANYAIGKATSHFFLRNQPMRKENDFRWEAYPSDGDIRHALKIVTGMRFWQHWEVSLSALLQTGRPYTAPLGTASSHGATPIGTWPPFNDGYSPGLGDEVIFSAKNAFRVPSYQRFDFRAAYNFSALKLKCNLFFQIYNLFYRKNTAYHETRLDHEHGERRFGLPVLPTLGLQFRF